MRHLGMVARFLFVAMLGAAVTAVPVYEVQHRAVTEARTAAAAAANREADLKRELAAARAELKATRVTTSRVSSATPSTPTPTSRAVSDPSLPPIQTESNDKSIVYLTAIQAVGTTYTVSYDEGQIFTGSAATKEAAGDGVPLTSTSAGVYVKNTIHTIRSVPFDTSATVVVWSSDDQSPRRPVSRTLTPAEFRTLVRATSSAKAYWTAVPFWMTVREGRIVKLEEQYLP